MKNMRKKGGEARIARPLMILPQVHLRKPCYDFYCMRCLLGYLSSGGDLLGPQAGEEGMGASPTCSLVKIIVWSVIIENKQLYILIIFDS